MSPIDRLSETLSKLPGVGLRQARRLAYFLLDAPPEFRKRIAEEVTTLPETLDQCDTCYRYFDGAGKMCTICGNDAVSNEFLMVVEKDIDLENIARSGSYNGRYFVLGGLLPLLEKKNKTTLRTKELVRMLENAQAGLKEVIIALNANPQGDNTTTHLIELLAPIASRKNVRITRLGRGLSTGTELEYSDGETISAAFQNRN